MGEMTYTSDFFKSVIRATLVTNDTIRYYYKPSS